VKEPFGRAGLTAAVCGATHPPIIIDTIELNHKPPYGKLNTNLHLFGHVIDRNNGKKDKRHLRV